MHSQFYSIQWLAHAAQADGWVNRKLRTTVGLGQDFFRPFVVLVTISAYTGERLFGSGRHSGNHGTTPDRVGTEGPTNMANTPHAVSAAKYQCDATPGLVGVRRTMLYSVPGSKQAESSESWVTSGDGFSQPNGQGGRQATNIQTSRYLAQRNGGHGRQGGQGTCHRSNTI
jgi:hypothetical protein